MDPVYTLDDVVRISDEAAVRQRFDRRNLLWLTWLLVFFAVTTFVLTVNVGNNTPLTIGVGATNFVLVVCMLVLIRDVRRFERAQKPGVWRPAGWIRRHVSATSITYVAVQYALVLFLTSNRSEGWVGWVITMPMMMLGFRLPVAELVLLHGLLLVGGVITGLVGEPITENPVPFFIAALVLNTISLGVELFASRRLRKQVITDWGARRTQAQEQIRMRDELRYARELQLSMLPERAPTVAWADFCAISIPATEVGGDYYDYFVDGQRVALVCGDVAGHGMASGLVLSALRSGFTLLRDDLHDPAAVLKRLHDLVVETSRRRMLVTVAVVLLDQANLRATIASAGHPPIVLARADGTAETIDLFAPPLGVHLPVDIPQRTIDLRPGDVFVLHSDGIYETRNERDEVYGLERLTNMVRDHDGQSAEGLRDAILADVDAFRGSAPQGDDVTVVVARIR